VLHASGRDDVWTLSKEGDNDRLGTTLAAGDLGGDGTDDLVAAATGRSVVQVLNGHRGGDLSRGALIPSPAGRTSQFGWTLTIHGRDLYIGAPGAGNFGGAVYRVNGKTRTTLQSGSPGELLGYAVL
jgi:hypothetical protein